MFETIFRYVYVYFAFRAVYPLAQSYSYAGDFTRKGKFLSAIRENVIFYGIAGVVLVAVIIFCVFTGIIK